MATPIPRPLVIAYAGVACSGHDAAFQVGQFGYDKSGDTFSCVFDVLVVGSTAAALQTNIDSLDAIRDDDGAFVLQMGREVEVNALVADGSTTVTSAAGGFLAAHEGLYITIATIGVRLIVTRNSATSITLASAVSTGTYKAFIAVKRFAGTHALNTFTNGKGRLAKVQGSPFNTELSQLFRVTINGDIPGQDPLKDATIGIVYDPARHRIVTMRGTYVPFDHDSDGDVDNAKAVHDALIGTFTTNHLSAFGGISSYELVQETGDYPAGDDPAAYAGGALPAKEWRWSRTYRERFVADHDNIIFQTLVPSFTNNTIHGLKGKIPKVMCTVQYGCSVNHDVITNTGLRAFYIATVRPLITAAIRLYGNTNEVVIESEGWTPNQTTNTLAAIWTVYLPGLSSDILEYSSTTIETLDLGLDTTALWDAKDHTYATFETGPQKTKSVQIAQKTKGPPSGGSGAYIPGLLYVDGVQSDWMKPQTGGNVGATDAPIGITVTNAGSGSGGGGGGGGGPGSWQSAGSTTITRSQIELGNALLGPVNKATIYSESTVTNFLWVIPAAPVEPAFQGGGGDQVHLDTDSGE